MGLLQDLRGLNAAYAEVHASMQEDQDKGYVVTAADKKGNTKAWQGYKAGVKSKTTGKPLYRAADHLKKEEANRESQLWDQVAANLTELHELRGVKYKVVLFNEDAQSDAVAQMSGDGGDPQDDAVKQVAGKKKKAKKDYDGDGKIETGSQEYLGSRDKAIKKAMKKEHHQKDADGKVIEHGDGTPSSLDEKYGKIKTPEKVVAKVHVKKDSKLPAGKMNKEQIEIAKSLLDSGKFSEDEVKGMLWDEGYQREPDGGEAKERQRRREQKGGDRSEKVRGERTPMPPRGDKRREEFERWYAANVR